MIFLHFFMTAFLLFGLNIEEIYEIKKEINI
jgi:hypothetical protein